MLFLIRSISLQARKRIAHWSMVDLSFVKMTYNKHGEVVGDEKNGMLEQLSASAAALLRWK